MNKKIVPKMVHELTALIKELETNKRFTPEEIKNYLSINNRIATDNQIKFYSQILSARVFNKPLNLPDILNNKKFYAYIYYGDYINTKQKLFTNDKLYWLSVLGDIYNEQPEVGEKLSQSWEYLNFEDANIDINIQTLAIQQSLGDYQSGYNRDYNLFFSFIGANLYPEIKKSVADGDFDNFTKKTFKFDGKDYVCYKRNSEFGDEIGLRVIYKDGTKQDEIKKITNDTVDFNSKTSMKEGIKVNKIDPLNAVYLSQNIKLVDFCPSFVYVKTSLPFCFLVKVPIDILKLENYLYKKINEKIQNSGQPPDLNVSDFFSIGNVITWDTFDLFINFLAVEVTTKFYKIGLLDLFCTNVANFIEYWKDIKSDFYVAKRMIEKVISFMKNFFTSFKNKVNTEKMYKLSKEYNTI